MHAQDVLNDSAVDIVTGLDTPIGINKETLTTDGTANVRGYLRWLAYLHGKPAFVLLPFRLFRVHFSAPH